MARGASPWYGVGPIVKINETMDHFQQFGILNYKMES